MIDCKSVFRAIANIALATTILISGQALATAQQIYYVDSPADDPTMSSGDKDGRITLREAVMAATSRRAFGDAPAGWVSNTINLELLSASLSKNPGRIILHAPIEVYSNGNSYVFITSGPSGKNVVIDGNEKCQLFKVGGTASLSFHWVDLTNGRGFNGGAVSVEDSGELRFALGEITKCQADNHGGAVFFNSSNVLDISHASLIDNVSEGSGGAVCLLDGDIDVSRVTVARNEAGGYGGGLYINSRFGSLNLIQEATIVYNHAYSTGRFPQAGGIAEAVRSTGEVILEGVLVAENTAPIYGWQLPNDIDAAVSSSLSRSNLIGSVLGNMGITDGVSRNQLGSVFIPIAPMLSSLGYHGASESRNFIPNPNSPAIDGGVVTPFLPSFIHPKDQRGTSAALRISVQSNGSSFQTNTKKIPAR